MADKEKRLDPEALVQSMLENREKRMAAKPLPDMYFYVRPGAILTILGPRGGHRGAYANPEGFLFHLDQVIAVGGGPGGAEVIFETSPPWENTAVRAADIEIKAAAEADTFFGRRRNNRS